MIATIETEIPAFVFLYCVIGFSNAACIFEVFALNKLNLKETLSTFFLILLFWPVIAPIFILRWLIIYPRRAIRPTFSFLFAGPKLLFNLLRGKY